MKPEITHTLTITNNGPNILHISGGGVLTSVLPGEEVTNYPLYEGEDATLRTKKAYEPSNFPPGNYLEQIYAIEALAKILNCAQVESRELRWKTLAPSIQNAYLRLAEDLWFISRNLDI